MDEPKRGEWGLWYAGSVGFATREAAAQFIQDGRIDAVKSQSVSSEPSSRGAPAGSGGLNEQDAKRASMREKRIRDAEAGFRRHGMPFKLMHVSALSPTTRKSHADRHGNLYTPAEAREWWAKDDNAVGCKCAVVEVLVDEFGNPLVEAIVKRAKANYAVVKLRGKAEWTRQ